MSTHYTSKASYIATCKCLVCNKIYKAKLARIDAVDPPCPSKSCTAARVEADIQRRAENIAAILAAQKAPGQIGSITAKAIDYTNQLVVDDYGMSDIKDRVKVGEDSVPRLAPVLQEQADNFWGGGNAARVNPALAQRVSTLGAQAMAGAFRPVPNAPVAAGGHVIDSVMSQKKVMPYKIVASDRR